MIFYSYLPNGTSHSVPSLGPPLRCWLFSRMPLTRSGKRPREGEAGPSTKHEPPPPAEPPAQLRPADKAEPLTHLLTEELSCTIWCDAPPLPPIAPPPRRVCVN